MTTKDVDKTSISFSSLLWARLLTDIENDSGPNFIWWYWKLKWTKTKLFTFFLSSVNAFSTHIHFLGICRIDMEWDKAALGHGCQGLHQWYVERSRLCDKFSLLGHHCLASQSLLWCEYQLLLWTKWHFRVTVGDSFIESTLSWKVTNYLLNWHFN